MISSKDNEKIKLLKKLKQKKYRDRESKFLVFGPHLIQEAKKHGEVIEIFTSNNQQQGTLISKELMKEINFTETPYDSLALCEKVDKQIDSNLVLVLEDVQDPDNVGALLRSASAFGFNKVIVSTKSADIYNEKTIRASKGAIFHLSIERKDVYEAVKEYQQNGYTIYATAVNGSSKAILNEKAVLVLGNEGSGITEQMFELSNTNLTIKTNNVESLNVSVAGSILMYEWSKI